ncbi:MAG: hypothetical protein ABEH47_02945 [Haloferacaceae archaeon]
MATLVDLIAELFGSLLRLAVIFVTEVALRDPLAFLSFAVGALLTTATVAFFAYLVAGAAVDLLGITLESPGRTPPRRD